MYAQLGDIIYEVLVGFQTLEQSEEENYVEHALINGKPELDKVGSKLDTVEIGIRFHKDFTDPDLEINRLREHRKKGNILALIMGDGRIIGDFVIKSMSISTKELGPDGITKLAELSVSLLEYYSADRNTAAKNQAINDGFANSQNTPPVSAPTNIPATPTMQAAESLTSGNANIQAVAPFVDQLDAASTLLKTTCEQLKTKVVKGLMDIAKVIALIDADASSELYANTRDLSSSASVLVTNLTDLATNVTQLISDIDSNPGAVPAGIAQVGEDVTTCLTQLEQIKTDASKMAAMAALKK